MFILSDIIRLQSKGTEATLRYFSSLTQSSGTEAEGDWLTKVGHSIMSTGKMATVLTGSTGSHCCFHCYFTKLRFVRYNKTNMSCQCGYPDGMSPLGKTILPLEDIP